MLKTRVGDELWLVHQPDHSRVAGYLAAHWGGRNGFARPGYFAPNTDPERLREEVVLAIAEHDNGWWEWEAAPTIDSADGYPLGLAEVGQRSADEAFQRWRNGVPRFASQHPYVSLLISLHAYYLYVFAFDVEQAREDELRHPLFGGRDKVGSLVRDEAKTRLFLSEQERFQAECVQRLRQSPEWAAAIEKDHLRPHVRLLQLLDAMSLLLSFGGQHPYQATHVPRSGWSDPATLTWTPKEGRRIVVDPFPFDLDPLEVLLPVRIVRGDAAFETSNALPMTRLHSIPVQTIHFELTSKP